MSELAIDQTGSFDPGNLSVNQSPLQCFHYHSVGHRCGSPAMRGEYFCYYHRDSLKPAPVIIFPTSPFELPRLTDRESILRAADEVASRIAANSLDLRRAKALLSAIYIAAGHLPPAPPPAAPSLPAELRSADARISAATIEIEISQSPGALHVSSPQQQLAPPAQSLVSIP